MADDLPKVDYDTKLFLNIGIMTCSTIGFTYLANLGRKAIVSLYEDRVNLPILPPRILSLSLTLIVVTIVPSIGLKCGCYLHRYVFGQDDDEDREIVRVLKEMKSGAAKRRRRPIARRIIPAGMRQDKPGYESNALRVLQLLVRVKLNPTLQDECRILRGVDVLSLLK